jgi:poly-gamma-glutamate synthesis protein (capsule biosynthesis protein)
MSTEPVTLAFIGDIMLGRHIDSRLQATHPHEFWGDVLPVLRAADAVIGNLECPITTYAHQWRRTWKAFRFRARPKAVDVLETANVRMVNLANNHMLDHQEQGLLDTINYLDRAGIAHAGAGRNAYDAAKPAIASVAGVKVGLIGLTDNMPEWSAGHRHPGTNYVKIRSDNVTLNMVRHLIKDSRWRGAEIIVVSCHWGPNLRIWPPKSFQRFAHHVIELGADVFHGHSAHLIQGIELHQGGLILYDTGDILDDFWIFPGFRTDRSFVFTAEFRDGRFARLVMQPVSQQRTTVHLAEGADFKAICRQMTRRCRPFGTVVAPSTDGLEIVAPMDASMRPAAARQAEIGIMATTDAVDRMAATK